ncbi:hypothetical protein [Streptomyces narbonensis]
MPALVLVSVLAVVSSLLESASTASTGVLEPKVQRVATERYLSLVARVEMDAAIEDDAFHKLMRTRRSGAPTGPGGWWATARPWSPRRSR